MRGRRVALLLTGVLPLLAKDDVPATENNVTVDENDIQAVRSASKALHDDALQHLPPLRLLGSNLGNIVMVEPVFDAFGMEDVYDQAIMENMIIIDQDQEGHRVTQTEQTSDEQRVAGEESDEPYQRLEMASEDVSEVDEQDATDEPDEVTEKCSQDASKFNAKQTTSDLNTTEDNKSPADATEESVLHDQVTKEGQDEDEEVVSERLLVDYASKSAGALILEKSPAMKGTSNLLNADNDKYAIAPCAEKKSVVIGLSEDILVKQVKIANYERYSSHLQNFQIMGSQTMKNWHDLGTYTASPGLGEQVFELNESAWARYLKFRFLTHYGSEHYCTLSQIKVHGSTMLQGFHEQWGNSQEDMEGENAAARDSAEAPAGVTDACGGETDVSSLPGENGVPADESNVDSQRYLEDDTFGNPVETVKTNTDTTKEEQSGGAPSVDSTYEASVTDGLALDVSTKAGQKPSPQEEVRNETSSETTSDNSSDLKVEPRTSVLLSASIKVSSHGAIESDHTRHSEALGVFAIKAVDKGIKTVVVSAVKAVVAGGSEAMMAVKVGPAVVFASAKELQQKLKMKIEIVKHKETPSTLSTENIHSNHNDESNDLKSESDSEETQERDSNASTVNVNVNQDDLSDNDVVSKAGPVEVSPSANDSAQKDSVDTTQEEISENSEACIKPSKESAINMESAPDDSKIRNKEATDYEGNGDRERLDVALSSVLARFPSASCLEALDYQDFKAKVIAARKGGANAGAGHAQGHGGKIEPIFKTLTDEIKALQINQSVQDQYLKALVSCHQRLMLEMAETLRDVETRQERRLSDLEDAMDAMRSSKLSRISDVLTSISSFFVAYAGSFSAVVLESVKKFSETDVIGRKAVVLVAGSILTKTTSILARRMSFSIACAGSFYSFVAECYKSLIETGVVDRNAVILGVGAFMLSVLTIALYSSTRPRGARKSTCTRKKDANTGAREAKRQSHVNEVMPTLKHDYQSGNEAEDGNLSVRTTTTIVPPSCGKRSAVTPEPDLVPAD